MSQESHSWSRCSRRRDSDAALSNPEIPKKAVTQMTGVNNSSWKRAAHECDASCNVEHSQVRTQENVQSTKTWKQETGTSSNDSSWKRVARKVSAAEIQTGFYRYRLSLEDLQIITAKFENSRRIRIICSRGLQDQHPDVVIVHVVVSEGSKPSWIEI